jgi:VanZ family protein
MLMKSSTHYYYGSSRTSSEAVAELRSSNVFAWILCAGYMAVIFYLSSLSDLPIPSLFHSQDFFLHILEYSVLGYFLSMAFANTGLRRSIGLYAFLFTMLYGASDELHQVLVPLRDPSLEDFFADSLGGSLGMFVYYAFSNAEGREISANCNSEPISGTDPY